MRKNTKRSLSQSDPNVESSHAEIVENFANYFFNTEASAFKF